MREAMLRFPTYSLFEKITGNAKKYIKADHKESKPNNHSK